jgi:hypothetical protein
MTVWLGIGLQLSCMRACKMILQLAVMLLRIPAQVLHRQLAMYCCSTPCVYASSAGCPCRYQFQEVAVELWQPASAQAFRVTVLRTAKTAHMAVQLGNAFAQASPQAF